MMFILKANIEFEAEDIDNALLYLKLHFSKMSDSVSLEDDTEEIDHIGEITVELKKND